MKTMNISLQLNGSRFIHQIHEACDGRILKVIIETCLLTEEKIKMYEIVTKAGVEYIELSKGFSTAGVRY